MPSPPLRHGLVSLTLGHRVFQWNVAQPNRIYFCRFNDQRFLALRVDDGTSLTDHRQRFVLDLVLAQKRSCRGLGAGPYGSNQRIAEGAGKGNLNRRKVSIHVAS